MSGIHRTSLEPRGGIEPPRPLRRSHGYGPAFCYSTRHISAYFLRLTKSRCGMPARRAPDRLACVALHSVTVTIGLCSVRLPRMGATQYSRWTELHSLGATLLLAPAYMADSVSTRSAGRSRFLCVGTPGQVIAATAFLPDTMTVGLAAWRARPSAQFIGWVSAVRHIAHSRGSSYTAATPAM